VVDVAKCSMYEKIDRLIINCFTSCSRIFHLYGDITITNGRAAKSRLMLGAQGLWAGSDLYRATPTVTRDLGFSGLIRRIAPFSRLLRYTRGLWKIYSNTDLHGSCMKWNAPYQKYDNQWRCNWTTDFRVVLSHCKMKTFLPT
jgi:hypothetical protein